MVVHGLELGGQRHYGPGPETLKLGGEQGNIGGKEDIGVKEDKPPGNLRWQDAMQQGREEKKPLRVVSLLGQQLAAAGQRGAGVNQQVQVQNGRQGGSGTVAAREVQQRHATRGIDGEHEGRRDGRVPAERGQRHIKTAV